MSTSNGAKLYEGFREIANEACEYFGKWTYDVPIAFSTDTNRQMHNIHKILHKSIRYFVEHYDEYRSIMPVTEEVYKILTLCKRKQYRVGTFRTDFLIDKNNNIKIIEITCRFALNGFFTSGFTNKLADRFLEDKPLITKIDEYTEYYKYLMEYFGDFNHVCILKGEDNKNETKYSKKIFEKAGYKVHIIPVDLISENLYLLKNAAVISELDHNELCSLPIQTIEAIIDSNLLNDLRTVFLIHDKRFFSILNNDAFLYAALNHSEIDFFKQYLVPTYMWNERPDLWQEALADKEHWIIKPRVFGKSINVFAGCVTGEQEWQALFSSGQVEDMILQHYIEQRRFPGVIGTEIFNDYVVGTLLFFDQYFFGPGIFRASSYPVTNRVDDRKIAPLVTADTKYFNKDIVL